MNGGSNLLLQLYLQRVAQDRSIELYMKELQPWASSGAIPRHQLTAPGAASALNQQA